MTDNRDPDYLAADDESEFDKQFGDWRKKAGVEHNKAMEVLFLIFMSGIVFTLVGLALVLLGGFAKWIWNL